VRVFRRISLIAAACIGAAISGARVETQGAQGLFVDVPALNTVAVQQSSSAVRSRFVLIDFNRLAERQILPFSLFPGVDGTAAVTSVETTSTGYVWTGELVNGQAGRVTLAVAGNALAGSISIGESTFSVGHVGGGVHVIEEVNQAAFPPELPPLDPQTLGPAANGQPPVDPRMAADDGSTIDVLVVYTPSARAAQGGTSAMQARIDLGIAETNQAYADSGVIQRLRLVRQEEIAYTEAGMSTDLTMLAGTSDGVMDTVHALRNSYGADLVQLIVNDSSACGIAYLMTNVSASFASAAFGVTHYSCISPNYSFAHEMGHNMGLHHDQYMTGSSTGAYAYSRGYVNQAAFQAGAPTNKRWRDIMAYNDQCAGSGFFCARLKYFSNPGNIYLGDPMGNASSADAVRSLNDTRVTVANFRQSDASEAPTVTAHPADLMVSAGQAASFSAAATGTPSPTVQWQVSTNGGSTFSNIGGATSTTYAFTAASTDHAKRYRAVFANAGGSATTNSALLSINPSIPAMAVDTPFNNTTVTPSFTISGWAVDRAATSGTGVDVLHIWAFPQGSSSGMFLAVPAYGSARPDIGAALGSQFTNSGFSANVSLTPGQYLLLVYSHSSVTGNFEQVIGHNITVQAPATQPYTHIDTPQLTDTRSRSQPFTISGWAIDLGSTSGTGITDIHIWAFQNGQPLGTFVCVGTYGQSRPDVGNAFGNSRFDNSGYSCTVPADTFAAGTTWFFVVFGNSTVTGGFTQSAGAWVTFEP
jgi:hypothetical protein